MKSCSEVKAVEILIAVQKAGATLRVDGNSLVASHASRLAPALKAAIRENKPQIITALAKPVCVMPKPKSAESPAYHATSAGPDGAVCKVTIVELPQVQRYRKTFALLQTKCPALVPPNRWKACVEDGKRFLAKWGEQAEALGWTSADLFGLHTPPATSPSTANTTSRRWGLWAIA